MMQNAEAEVCRGAPENECTQERNTMVMDILTDDIIYHLVAFCSPNDLVNLATTCKRFGETPGGIVIKTKKKRRKRAIYSTQKRRNKSNREDKLQKEKDAADRAEAIEFEGRDWCLVEEGAKKLVDAEKCSNAEWDTSKLSDCSVGESWIAVYHRLLCQRKSLVFSRLFGNGLDYVKGDISHVQVRRGRNGAQPSLAYCQETMTTGKHYAKFTMDVHVRSEAERHLFPIGLMRPIQSRSVPNRLKLIPKSITRSHVAKLPSLYGYEKYCSENSERAGFEGDIHHFFLPIVSPIRNRSREISTSLTLNLEDGTLSVHVGARTFVIERGFSGHYHWVVSPSWSCPTVKVERGQVPEDAGRNVLSDAPRLPGN